MKICPACQLQNHDTAHFCARCGKDLCLPRYSMNTSRKRNTFWWIPAGIFAACTLLAACIFFFGKSMSESITLQPELPIVELSDYTPDPSASYLPAAEVLPVPTPSPSQTPNEAEVSDDFFLYNLVQGMWVSEVDVEGCCTRLLIHGKVAAMSVANPLTENAEPRAWKDGDWESDIWNWDNCNILNGTLYLRDRVEEIPFRIYPVSDTEFTLEFNYTDTQEGDSVTFYRIQPPEEFNLADFLEGDWLSDGTIQSDATIHGLYKFNRDGSGEIGRATTNTDVDVYDYERVFTIVYSTNDLLLTCTDQNNTVSEYAITIDDAFTITFGDETFRRLGG